jgi:hypothetical protein
MRALVVVLALVVSACGGGSVMPELPEPVQAQDAGAAICDPCPGASSFKVFTAGEATPDSPAGVSCWCPEDRKTGAWMPGELPAACEVWRAWWAGFLAGGGCRHG